jgi:hypothetical protein
MKEETPQPFTSFLLPSTLPSLAKLAIVINSLSSPRWPPITHNHATKSRHPLQGPYLISRFCSTAPLGHPTNPPLSYWAPQRKPPKIFRLPTTPGPHRVGPFSTISPGRNLSSTRKTVEQTASAAMRRSSLRRSRKKLNRPRTSDSGAAAMAACLRWHVLQLCLSSRIQGADECGL